MAIHTDLAQLLATQGFGVWDPTGGTSTIFTHTLPPQPASAISVIVPVTEPPGPFTFDSALPQWENPRVQITVRDPVADTAYATAYGIYQALAGLSEVTLGGVRIYKVRLINGPNDIGLDDNNWMRYVMNYAVQRDIG